jgi:hypothetical protein
MVMLFPSMVRSLHKPLSQKEKPEGPHSKSPGSNRAPAEASADINERAPIF